MISQKGFMVLNTILVIAILSMIALGAGMTTAQILQSSELNKDYSTVVRQAQNLGFSVSEDMLMARVVYVVDNATTPDVEFITAIWKEWESGYKHDVRYVWSNPDDSLKSVIRQHTIYDNGGLEISSVKTLLAQNIYSANLTQPNDTWILTVEARSGNRSAIREYEANQRVE